jgi:sigma-B regulation protein RsbU (phosphoserine phosphatase)
MLNIRSAICAPIHVDNEVVGVLYLDTRGGEKPIQRDAAAFCVGLCQLGGMALANLRRAELARKEKEMRDELKAARAAQQQMLPDPQGEIGPIRYGLVAVPGMIVAGDMFDIIPLGDTCALVMLGDVMGKGAAAGLMMATVQTYFRARCQPTSDLAQLMSEANAYFFDRFKGQGFVTLWIGRFESPNRLTYVDAGHGHWGMAQTGHGFGEVDSLGGPPIGAFPTAEYEAGELELPTGDRIILYSDGLTEQHDEQGKLFETTVGLTCLTNSCSANDDVRLLLEAQDAFRGSVPLSDDLTIASIEWK